VRRIIGNRTVDLSAVEFAELRERHDGVLLDVGAGDGRYVLYAARC
jgi:hypothetical protein